MKRSYLTTEIDQLGHLILPPELLTQYGIVPGALVKLEESATGFSISRSSDNLARVYIEPTNICNLDCATCMRNVWDEPLGKMSYDTFERIINGIELLNLKPSIFFGGFGEPLTHPRILDMVAVAKQAGSRVELITNGILLSPEICSRFIELELDRLWVSLDGATPESYADVRLGDMFPRVVSNLDKLRYLSIHARTKYPKLGIAFVAIKRNIHDLPKIIDLGKKLGADMFSISNVLPHTKEMLDEALYLSPLNGEVSINEWSPLLSLPRMEVNDLTKGPIIEAINKVGSIAIARRDITQGANICPFVEKGSVSIRWDGAVSPCLALLHDNENYLESRKRKSQAYSIENINKYSLIEIWENPTYIALRKRLLEFDFAYCTSCNSCYMADSNMEDCFGTPTPACGACIWAQGLIQCP